MDYEEIELHLGDTVYFENHYISPEGERVMKLTEGVINSFVDDNTAVVQINKKNINAPVDYLVSTLSKSQKQELVQTIIHSIQSVIDDGADWNGAENYEVRYEIMDIVRESSFWNDLEEHLIPEAEDLANRMIDVRRTLEVTVNNSITLYWKDKDYDTISAARRISDLVMDIRNSLKENVDESVLLNIQYLEHQIKKLSGENTNKIYPSVKKDK